MCNINIFNPIFTIPQSYRNRIEQFTISDTVLAFAVIAAYFATEYILGYFASSISKTGMIFTGCIVNLFFTVIVLLILYLKHQEIASVGLREGNIKLSFIMGGILSAILFFLNCVSNLLFEHQSFIPVINILINIFYYFTVGLSEEVMFRGFLETRLHALTKRVWLDVFITGIMFVLMHFPFRMIAYHKTFLELLLNVRFILDLFITHLILSYIRIKSDSLYGAILPHWISDLAYGIVTHI